MASVLSPAVGQASRHSVRAMKQSYGEALGAWSRGSPANSPVTCCLGSGPANLSSLLIPTALTDASRDPKLELRN